MEIKEILKRIERRGLFHSITRHDYLNYDINKALEVFEAIGKSRDPRFKIDTDNRFVYANIIRWIHGDTNMKALHPTTKKEIQGRTDAGLYIAGATGTGKSWTLEIASAYCAVYDLQIGIGSKDIALRWNNLRTDEICNTYSKTGDVETVKRISVAGFQDLGAEQLETLFMGNRLNVMKQILEYRGDKTDCVTMISSNLPMNNDILRNNYGDRVVSRLSAMCNYYELRGKDRRG